MLYPILTRDADTPTKQGLALWYVGTRITESTVFIVGILGLLSMFALSREIAAAGAGQSVQLVAIGSVLKTITDYSMVLGQSVFCVAPLMLVAGFLLPLTGDPNSTISSILYAPMGLQEMVLAVWLIARGFNPPATA
jgi:hypothetical protein